MTGLLVILKGCISKGPADERGERGRVFFLGGADLSQPPVNFSKFLVLAFKREPLFGFTSGKVTCRSQQSQRGLLQITITGYYHLR